MTELEIAAKVATHPLVIQYRKAVQLMHRRMTAIYGPDYACPEVGREAETHKGITRMSELDANRFASLLRGAAIIRRDVRNSLV